MAFAVAIALVGLTLLILAATRNYYGIINHDDLIINFGHVDNDNCTTILETPHEVNRYTHYQMRLDNRYDIWGQNILAIVHDNNRLVVIDYNLLDHAHNVNRSAGRRSSRR